MSTSLSELHHHAALLQSFVDFVDNYCKQSRAESYYVEGTPALFDYVSQLATGTSKYLAVQVPHPSSPPLTEIDPDPLFNFDPASAILRLNAVKGFWSLLHAQ